MLVTKKSKPGDTGKNTRNSRKVSNTPSVNHGNQYSLLADIHEDSEPTINRQHADKNNLEQPHDKPPKGGRPAAARGRGRGLGRGHGLSHDIPHTNSSFTGLMNQPNSQNVFQFGGAHPPSSNMTEGYKSTSSRPSPSSESSTGESGWAQGGNTTGGDTKSSDDGLSTIPF
nr:hypothetical protein Iba_chr10fCG7800 [Ipomoea batatas]